MDPPSTSSFLRACDLRQVSFSITSFPQTYLQSVYYILHVYIGDKRAVTVWCSSFFKWVFLQTLNFCFLRPALHSLASLSIKGRNIVNTYSYLIQTHPHLVTGQTARLCHEFFPIWCSPLNTCIILSWHHATSVSAVSWFSFNPFRWTHSLQKKLPNNRNTWHERNTFVLKF